MKILFDLNHPVDVNFFKPSMLYLKKEGHDIYVMYRNRGKLGMIIKYEIPMFPILEFGDHKRGFINKITSQLYRDYKLISYLKKEKFDLVVCFGPTSAISAKFCGIPYLAFDDDFEYKIPFYHANRFATRHIFPDFIEFNNSKTYKYRGFKELAYLHPNQLKISTQVLDDYSLDKDNYVFIREISNISLNYKDENTILTGLLKEFKKEGTTVVLSLENKELKKEFENQCLILEEPVSDIYSLIFHSRMTISSGDTVAREAALLGVPTIYTGGRKMIMNKVLVEKGLLYELNKLKEVISLMQSLELNKGINNKIDRMDMISKEWDDTTNVILNHILDFQTKQDEG